MTRPVVARGGARPGGQQRAVAVGRAERDGDLRQRWRRPDRPEVGGRSAVGAARQRPSNRSPADLSPASGVPCPEGDRSRPSAPGFGAIRGASPDTSRGRHRSACSRGLGVRRPSQARARAGPESPGRRTCSTSWIGKQNLRRGLKHAEGLPVGRRLRQRSRRDRIGRSGDEAREAGRGCRRAPQARRYTPARSGGPSCRRKAERNSVWKSCQWPGLLEVGIHAGEG